MALNLQVGDMVELKKQHPCGSKKFEIIRTGADFRIKCQGCEKQLWLPRVDLEKRIKKITPKDHIE